jgi:two-component system OmpR family response regulator
VSRVLFVDDDPLLTQLAKRGLELAGLTVVTASSGREALTIAAQGGLDMVLLDQRMPGLDGITTLERLRSEPSTRGLLVAIVTADRDPALAARCRALGACAIVPKPFDPRAIGAEVARLIDEASR